MSRKDEIVEWKTQAKLLVKFQNSNAIKFLLSLNFLLNLIDKAEKLNHSDWRECKYYKPLIYKNNKKLSNSWDRMWKGRRVGGDEYNKYQTGN